MCLGLDALMRAMFTVFPAVRSHAIVDLTNDYAFPFKCAAR